MADRPDFARIKSFTLRGSRLGDKYEELLAQRGPEFVIDLPTGHDATAIATSARFDVNEAFGREAPLAVEIGPGSGEQLVSYASDHPDWNVLALEAWHPGVARCVARAVRHGVTNVRVIEADAAQALPILFGLESAGLNVPEQIMAAGDRVDRAHQNAGNPRAQMLWTFFPDPWRKARHRKRRIVSESFTGIAAGLLATGGAWRLATDWDDYAWQMRDTVEAAQYFDNPHVGQLPDPNDPEPERGGYAPRWEERIMTRFEERGIEAGRTIHDIEVIRHGRSS
ncbi:MAG: tRNA (guanine(46)-N(7))-methyltransferase TrmB [Ancrocorticia sp.]|uniref:tRNA (guanine(46)-N(7))-methyltransferase TrmB n=1 Tax=Ancrocorticia sp. TaxID=2593684 RepID=UPI003F93AC46